jgi:hypothetical protein
VLLDEEASAVAQGVTKTRSSMRMQKKAMVDLLFQIGEPNVDGEYGCSDCLPAFVSCFGRAIGSSG